MDEIGESLRLARESSGVSLAEVSKDLNLDELVLQCIEEGKIGSFKDILELKDNIGAYAKYLGLDSEKIVDDFNEFLFEYTSKIPVKELEKTMELQQKELDKIKEKEISSPYTNIKQNYTWYYVVIGILILILVVIIVIWCVKQMLMGQTEVASRILEIRK